MASSYKRNKQKKNEPYLIQYKDEFGKRKTVTGFTDKGKTEELKAKLVAEARLRKTGLVDARQERIAAARQAPIDEHLSAFEENLAGKAPRYLSMTVARIKNIIAGCDFSSLADIQCEAVQTYLRRRRKTEKRFGVATSNYYIVAFGSFCNWCVETHRLLSSPLKGVEKLNTAVDIRRPRRVLSPAEMGRLLKAAETSKKSVRSFNGQQRARIYRLGYMTGLRKSEIASLTPRSFALDEQPPTLRVEAKDSKHRQKDVLPLHPDLAAQVRTWIAGMAPTERLFPGLAPRNTAALMRHDLANAGIPYRTEEGYADFHAGRHAYITQLANSGAPLPAVKDLARHRNIQTTMKYIHVGMADRARALSNLPLPGESPRE
jgi:integrase